MALIFMSATSDLKDPLMVDDSVEEIYKQIRKVSINEKHPFITLTLNKSYYDHDKHRFYSDTIILNYNMIEFVKP